MTFYEPSAHGESPSAQSLEVDPNVLKLLILLQTKNFLEDQVLLRLDLVMAVHSAMIVSTNLFSQAKAEACSG